MKVTSVLSSESWNLKMKKMEMNKTKINESKT